MVTTIPLAPAGTARDAETAAVLKAAWRLLPVLMLAYVCAYVDRINVGFAKLEMMQELGFSDAVYGFGAGVFFLGYFLFEVPSNLILHRVGARVWIARIMLTWGLISGAMMFVASPTQFYVMRFLLGAAEAGFIPGVIYFLTQWFPSAWRGRVLGVFYIALASSGVIGGPLSGAILQGLSGVGGHSGWQWLFALEALPTLVAGALVWLVLVDRPADAAWLSPAERAALSAAVEAENRTKAHFTLRALLSDRNLILMTGAFFINNFALYGLNFWMPTLIQRMGVAEPAMIGLAAGATSLLAIVSMVLVGRSADRCRERRWHLAGLFLCGTLGFALAGFGEHSVGIGLLGLCLAQMGILAVPAQFWALPTAILGGAGAAAGIALINSIANLSGFLGPYVIGFVKDATGTTIGSIYLISALLAVAAAMILCVPARLVDK
ncbi:MFS transporter [Methylobacterium sp. NEAU 140]|uniref:MFS transporter n=1 Tax=Methylobacterium sp. NEAU 140 TaxID=3064945 RepID=UPI00273261B1|nr:MFS transporter [Methylobacterium sp. NEAU 140]MDP4026860.1 MFS transporter [Methylobacterium sp. NEAU 140]